MSRTRRTPLKTLAGGALALAVVALSATAASAHIEPDVSEVAAGSYAEIFLIVPHGCDGEATSELEVQIPESVTSASPYVVPGWTADVTTEELATPIDDGEGGEITERDSVITWTAEAGNELPDHQITRFGISFKAPDEVGETLYFKTIQTCGDTTSDWITEWDGTGEEPEKPAPSVQVVASEGEDGHGAAEADDGSDEATDEGSGEAAAADTTSTDDSSDDSSSNGLAIAGLVAGLGGLVLGGAAFAKTRKQA